MKLGMTFHTCWMHCNCDDQSALSVFRRPTGNLQTQFEIHSTLFNWAIYLIQNMANLQHGHII